MPVTWSVLPGRPKAETRARRPIHICRMGRRDARHSRRVCGVGGPPTPHRPSRRRSADQHLRGLHGELLSRPRGTPARDTRRPMVSSGVSELLPDLRVGRFRIRTFDDGAEAVIGWPGIGMTTHQRDNEGHRGKGHEASSPERAGWPSSPGSSGTMLSASSRLTS